MNAIAKSVFIFGCYLVSVRKLMPGNLNIIIRGSYRIILIGFYVC